MIRVALADGHCLVREGLASLLSCAPDVLVVGCYASGGDLVGELHSCRPDVIVLEVSLPDGRAADLAGPLHHVDPSIRVIVLTGSISDADLIVALEGGVDGYLSKDDTPEALIGAIRDTNRDNFHMSAAAVRRIRDLSMASGLHALTPREIEVLAALQDGLTSKEIAGRLCLSLSTVKTHLGSIYRKLDARNRVEATREAQRRGIITAPK